MVKFNVFREVSSFLLLTNRLNTAQKSIRLTDIAYNNKNKKKKKHSKTTKGYFMRACWPDNVYCGHHLKSGFNTDCSSGVTSWYTSGTVRRKKRESKT